MRGSTLRLHILANSDDPRDQELKLLVRDALLREQGGLFEAARSRDDAVRIAREALPRVEETARRTLREQGCDDAVRAEVVEMYFSTRHYDESGIVMPAGQYDALRVLIGEGAGRNWWCVMYPPLCLPAAEDRQNALESGAPLLEDKPEYELKLAVVEAYESVKEYFAKLSREDDAA